MTKDGSARRSTVERRMDMIAAADRLLQRDTTADIAMGEVGRDAGASRALVYAYFGDRTLLLEAVCEAHVERLRAAGIVEAAGRGDFAERAAAVARIYLRHLFAHGAALEIILRDQPLARALPGAARRLRDALMRRLVRAARRDLRMTTAEAMALVQLLSVMPSEAARHARRTIVDIATAEAICDRLLAAAIRAQIPRADEPA